MTGTGRRPATRVLAAVLGAANLGLVVAPADVAAAVASGPGRPPPPGLVRLLGTRVVLQQTVVLAAPTRRIVLLGAAADALHAVSMVTAALRWPRHRRAAAVSAACAGLSALLELATAPAAPQN
jgi:hypothetical protein